MPIFEFKCKECGSKFEKIVFKQLEEAEIKCPNCESSQIEKLISAPGSVGVSSGVSSDFSGSSCSTGCCSCSVKTD